MRSALKRSAGPGETAALHDSRFHWSIKARLFPFLFSSLSVNERDAFETTNSQGGTGVPFIRSQSGMIFDNLRLWKESVTQKI